MNDLITSINDVLWTYVLIVALVGCGVWFTWRTRFVQFRMVGEMLRLLTESAVDTVETQVKEKDAKDKKRHISFRPLLYLSPPVWVQAIWPVWQRL